MIDVDAMYQRLQGVRAQMRSEDMAILGQISVCIEHLRALKTSYNMTKLGRDMTVPYKAFMPPVFKDMVEKTEQAWDMPAAMAQASYKMYIRWSFNKLGIWDGLSQPMIPLAGGQDNYINQRRAEILGMDIEAYMDLVESPDQMPSMSDFDPAAFKRVFQFV